MITLFLIGYKSSQVVTLQSTCVERYTEYEHNFYVVRPFDQNISKSLNSTFAAAVLTDKTQIYPVN